MKIEGWFFCNINTCKLEVEYAVLCLNMKDFSLLESVGKERIKKKQPIGKWQDYNFISSWSEKKSASGGVNNCKIVSVYIVKWLVKNFAPSVGYSEAIRHSRVFTNK